MKKFIVYLAVAISLALVGVAGVKIIKKKQEQEAKAKPPKEYEIVVKSIFPKKERVSLSLPYLAITKSNDDVKISSKIPSRINSIPKSGSVVKKGEVIIKLDDGDLKSKLQALKLNKKSLKSSVKAKKVALQNLYKTHERTKKLLEVRGATKEQFDKEVTNIEALKSGIKTIEYKMKEIDANIKSIINNLTYTTIKAPISGVVTRLANVGDVAMPGRPLVGISSDSNGYLLVRLPDSIKATAIIYKDQKISLTPLNTTFNGLLEYLANIDESLAANQKVEVSVVVYDGTGYKLPADAILNREGKSFVLVIKGNRAEAKEIKIVSEGEEGIVVEGVGEDEKLAVAKPDILLKLLSGISVKGL